ncbi:MAG: putative toxin-antitoxin system toxin component, PIN family [Oscillospiraceae bacterium]|jgi:putative PIN family toxin of toxin-antitoxin system|nr:putative toxin-antitoxin system toxin component, PIN family [Oscillospiraceae bacterium]
MDIMIDTNIVISAALFPGERINRFIEVASQDHTLFLCSYTLEEIARVVRKKFPERAHAMELFLSKLSFTLIHTPTVDVIGTGFHIRDKMDYPIWASAMVGDVDILITGDKDFDDLDVERPEIMTIAQFMQTYNP